MKKFMVFFMLVFIALTGNSFAVSDNVKKQIENNVLPALKAKNIQVESVDFSTKDVVKLKGISTKDAVVPGSTLKIAEVVFTGINEDVFSAKDGDMPLVAKSIDFNGFELAFTADGQKTSLSIANINADTPMQNIMGLLKKDLDQKSYVKLLSKITAKTFAYSDIKIAQDDTANGSGQLITIKSAKVNGLGLEKIKAFRVSGIEVKAKQGQNFTGEAIRMDSFVSVDLKIPSEEYILFIVENMKEIMASSLSPEKAKQYAELGKKLSIDNDTFKAKIENFVLEEAANKPVVKFKEIIADVLMDVKNNNKLDFSLVFNGTELDYKSMGVDPFMLMLLFQKDNPVLDYALKTTIKSDGELSSIAVYAIDEANGAAVKLETKIMFPKANLTEIFSIGASMEQTMPFFLNAQFAGFSIDSDALKAQLPNTPRPIVAFKGVKSVLDYDYTSSTSASLDVDFPGILVDLAQVAPEPSLPIAKALLNTDLLDLITSLKVKLVTDGSTSTVEYNAKVKDTGSLNAKISLIMPKGKIGELAGFPPDQNRIMQFFMGAAVSGLQITYEDSGLAPRGLKLFSDMQGAKPDQMLAQLVPMVSGVLEQQKQILTPTSIDAAKLCLQKPGKLTITATPKQPLPANPGSMMLLENPEAITYDIKCEAGKDIAETGTQPNKQTQIAESTTTGEQKKN